MCRRPQQKGKGAAKTSATAKPAAMAKGSGGSGGSKDVIAAEEED